MAPVISHRRQLEQGVVCHRFSDLGSELGNILREVRAYFAVKPANDMPEKRLKANRRFVVIVLAITLIAFEGISYVGQRILVGKGVIYQAPSEDFVRQVHEYKPDQLLGWPSPELLGTGEIDSSGSRLIPSFPDPGQEACVSTYGDSFTWGSEVTPGIA